MEIIGDWEGYYEYGEGYTLPQFGMRVSISVTFKGTNDKFLGTIHEEPSEHSVPLDATLHGFTENGMISFIKRYPKSPNIKEYGSAEMVIKNGLVEIEHIGYIDPDFNAIYGSWALRENEVIEGETFEVSVYGIWLLNKV